MLCVSLLIAFGIRSILLGRLHSFPNGGEVTQNDKEKFDQYKTNTKHKQVGGVPTTSGIPCIQDPHAHECKPERHGINLLGFVLLISTLFAGILGPLILTLINFDHLSIAPFGSLEMEMLFHLKLYWACDYVSMLGVELIYIGNPPPPRPTPAISVGIIWTLKLLARKHTYSNFSRAIDADDKVLITVYWVYSISSREHTKIDTA